jgi:hypothetical protein
MSEVELILRFFALYEFFDKDLNQFSDARCETLNRYMRERNKFAQGLEGTVTEQFENIENLRSLFEKTCSIVYQVFKNNSFKNYIITKDKSVKFSNTINYSIFDIQMLGFTDFTLEDILGKEEVIYEEFLGLCLYNREFVDAVSKSTSHKVNERVGIWKNTLVDIMENLDEYLENLKLKKEKFNNNPKCFLSNIEIANIHDAFLYNGELYHQAYCPLLDNNHSSTRITKNSSIKLKLNNLSNSFLSTAELYKYVFNIIKQNLLTMRENDKDSYKYHIDRLETFDFIGNRNKLNNNCKKETKRFLEIGLTNVQGDQLYINISGGRGEMISNIKDVAKIFNFINNFEIE